MEGIRASSWDCIKLVPMGVSRVHFHSGAWKTQERVSESSVLVEKKMVTHYLLNCDSRLFTMFEGFHKHLNPMWVLSILK